MHRRIPLIGLLFALLSSIGCEVSKDYVRPEMEEMPEQYISDEFETTDSTSIGELDWRQIYLNAELQDLIDTALANNYDLEAAYHRIEAARSGITVARSRRMPDIQYDISAGAVNIPGNNGRGAKNAEGEPINISFGDFFAGINASWEIDIFRRLHRLEERALAEALQTEAAAQAIEVNLVAEVAINYFNLLAFDAQRRAVLQNINLREQTLELVRLLNEGGEASGLALKQVEAELYNVRSFLPAVEQQIQIGENRINNLLGQYPELVDRDSSPDLRAIARIPVGIPTELLENRPDVRAAELDLVRANADIGIAKAALYPRLIISARGGFNGTNPANWFNIPLSLLGNAAAGLTGPIFQGKRNRANLAIAEAQEQVAFNNYKATVLDAYYEVQNAIYSIARLEEEIIQREAELVSIQEANAFTDMLFKAGEATYLEIITAQRTLLDTQLGIINLELERLIQFVELYRALGGGWR